MELHAVRPFLADDFGMVGVFLVFDEDCTAFAHAVVLGLVIAVAAKVTERPERATLVGGHHSLRSIFDDEQVVLFGDVVNRVHFAGDARIVHRHDGLCLFGNGAFDEFFVQVHRVGTDIYEYAFCSAHRKCIGGTHERERRHDDFVAGLYAAKQR